MSIGVSGRRILVAAAKVEIASRNLPFPVHIMETEQHFAETEAIPDSAFKVLAKENPEPNHHIYHTTLGTFDLTPQRALLRVIQDKRIIEEVQFFSDADVTASPVSAAIRFTERRADKEGQLPKHDKTSSLVHIEAALASRLVLPNPEPLPIKDQVEDVILYFRLLESLDNSKFKFLNPKIHETSEADVKTTLGFVTIQSSVGGLINKISEKFVEEGNIVYVRNARQGDIWQVPSMPNFAEFYQAGQPTSINSGRISDAIISGMYELGVRHEQIPVLRPGDLYSAYRNLRAKELD